MEERKAKIKHEKVKLEKDKDTTERNIAENNNDATETKVEMGCIHSPSCIFESFLSDWLLPIVGPYLDPCQYGLKGASIL